MALNPLMHSFRYVLSPDYLLHSPSTSNSLKGPKHQSFVHILLLKLQGLLLKSTAQTNYGKAHDLHAMTYPAAGLSLLSDLIEGTLTQGSLEDRLSTHNAQQLLSLLPVTWLGVLSYFEPPHIFSQKSSFFSISQTFRLQMSP